MKKLSILLLVSLFAHSFAATASYHDLEVKEWQKTNHFKEEFFMANTTYKIILYVDSDSGFVNFYKRLKKSNFADITIVSHKKHTRGSFDFYAMEINFNPSHTITKVELEKQLRETLLYNISPFQFNSHVSIENGQAAYLKYQNLNW